MLMPEGTEDRLDQHSPQPPDFAVFNRYLTVHWICSQSNNNSLKLFQVAFRQHLCPSVTNKLFTTQLKIHKKIRQSGKKVNKNSVHFSFPEKNPKHKVWLWRVRKIQFLALILQLVGGSQLSGGVYVAALSSRCTEELRRRPSAAELSDIVTLSVGRRSWVSVVEQKVLSTQFTRNCKCVWS